MFSRIKNFFQESRQELKRVNWPTPRETARLTGIVIGLAVGVAVFLGALDFLFVYIIKIVI